MDIKVVSRVKEFLLSRKQAYARTFNMDSPEARAVLEDLSKFCRAHDSSFEKDPRVHAVLEGRREVWLRIQKYLRLTPDELWEIYGRKK